MRVCDVIGIQELYNNYRAKQVGGWVCDVIGMQELYNNYQAKEVSECMTSSAFRSSTISTPPNR